MARKIYIEDDIERYYRIGIDDNILNFFISTLNILSTIRLWQW
jgi:hypothetical protein